MVKKIVLLVFLFIGIFPVLLYGKSWYKTMHHIIFAGVCDYPIHYRVDVVDPQFHLSSDQFQSDIRKAARIWDTAENKQLFVYDPMGALSINLLFDVRQKLTNQIGQLQNSVQNGEGSIKSQMSRYDGEVVDFKKRLADLNGQIQFWNSKGGAPADVYSNLKAQQKNLQDQADQLNTMGTALSRSADTYNAQVDNLNQTIDSFNQQIKLKPEEGLYQSAFHKITIYFDVTDLELIHTLAHEMGHALGLNHNNNQKSIMYPYTTDLLTPSSQDLLDLNKICEKNHLLETIQSKLQTILQKTKQ